MQETCGLVQQRWAQAGGGVDPEDPLLTAFVRLLVQFFSTQLRWVPGHGPGGQEPSQHACRRSWA